MKIRDDYVIAGLGMLFGWVIGNLLCSHLETSYEIVLSGWEQTAIWVPWSALLGIVAWVLGRIR